MSAQTKEGTHWSWLLIGTLLLAGACGDETQELAGLDAGDARGTDGASMPVDTLLPADTQDDPIDLAVSPDVAPADGPNIDVPPPADASATDAPPVDTLTIEAARPETLRVEVPQADAPSIDAPPAIDGAGLEASALDQSPAEGGSGWQQLCPRDQLPAWDAGQPGISVTPPVLTATTAVSLPNSCRNCSPQVAADEAGLLYALADKGQLAVSQDGGKSFAAAAAFGPSSYSTGAVQRLAAGRPGRVFVATTSAGECTTVLASWDAGQSWSFAKSVMPGQSELRLVVVGDTLAVAGVTSGKGMLAVGADESMGFDTVTFTTEGSFDLVVDYASPGALYLVTVENGAVVTRAWSPAQRTLGASVVTALPTDLTVFAMSGQLLVGASPSQANVYRVSLGTPMAVTSMAVPAGAAMGSVRGDAQGGFALLAYWNQPIADATNQSLRGYAAFHLPRTATELGTPWPFDVSRVATNEAYVTSGTGADIVPLTADLAFVADAFGVPHIGLTVDAQVLDWRMPPAAFP